MEKMGEKVHEARFSLSPRFYNSQCLTKVARPKSLVPFEGFDSRKGDLIAKGGDSKIELGGKSCNYYDPDAKLKQMK